MNEGVMNASQYQSMSQSSSSNNQWSGDLHYKLQSNGLKSPHYYQIFRKNTVKMISYIFSVSPSFTIIHHIMSILRIFQFLLPSFVPSFLNFWTKSSTDYIVINMLTTFCYIIPPTFMFSYSYIFYIVYIIIQSIYSITVTISSFYYKKYAKLPNFISIFIYFYEITFGHFLHPIVLFLMAQDYSYISIAGNRSKVNIPRLVVLHVFNILCIAFNFFVMFIFICQSLEYRPNSFASTLPIPQTLVVITVMLINFLFGIATYLSKYSQVAILCVIIFFYVISGLSVFVQGGFIHTFTSNIIWATSVTGSVFTLVDLILLVLNRKGNFEYIFSFILIFVLLIVVNFFFLKNIEMRELRLLDLIVEDHSYFSRVKSPNQLLLLFSCGIKFAHPTIVDTSFFLLGTEKWPNNVYIFFIYAKFIAIYPEETYTLNYLYQNMKMDSITMDAIKTVKEQIRNVLRLRETGLTYELRQKLNELKKKCQSTKHKLFHLWDVVIIGSLSEIEHATKQALSAIEDTNTEFERLLSDYPNNRNVAFLYSIFLKEIVGDKEMSIEMFHKAKGLLPGVITVDKMHEFALKTFPNLPFSIIVPQHQQTQDNQQNQIVPNLSIMAIKETKDLDAKKAQQIELEKIAGIKMNIRDLRIPSIFGTKIIRVLTTIIFFILPTIAALIFISIYSHTLTESLYFLNSLSLLRTFAFQLVGFILRFVGETMSIFNSYFEYEHNKPPPKYFGNSWNTREHLEFIVKEATDCIREFDKFRDFQEDNPDIYEARNLVFQNTIPYVYYVSSTNFTTSMISVQAALLDFTFQAKTLLTATDFDYLIFNTGVILNPVNNITPIVTNFHTCIKYFLDNMKSNYLRIKKVEKVVLVILIIIIILVYSVTLIIQLKWIKSNKREVYQCLFSIPKNVIYELTETKHPNKNQNQQQSENGDDSVNDKAKEKENNQEINILKIFNSSDSVSKNSFTDSFLILLCTVIIIILIILSSAFILHIIFSLIKILISNSPHLHYGLASYSLLMGSINWLTTILFGFGGISIPSISFNSSILKMRTAFEWSRYYYHIIETGSQHTDGIPLKGLLNGIPNTNLNCSININNSLFLSSAISCSTVDIIYLLIEPVIKYTIVPYQKGSVQSIDPKDPTFGTIWLLLISPLYEEFFRPIHDSLIHEIIDEFNSIQNKFIQIVICMFIVVIFIEFLIYLQVKSIDKHIRQVLSFLCHFKPSVIFSSSKITRVLGADFSHQQNDSFERNTSFFDMVFVSLPDAIMYSNQSDMIIQNANLQCERLFGENQLIGKSMKDFFLSERFSENTDVLFSSVNSNPTIEIEYKMENNKKYFKATSMIACNKFVISCRDVTQSHNYNTLILEEKQNSDKLLSTILPPLLVSRVQEGETNISFSVQSASILFSDIVSFTPWCGSLPAQVVMSTLNILFKRMDAILDTKSTMTKIKCIGDCYMAAGGIFAEINQPAIHAKEVVDFGIQSIKEILVINTEINQNLRIRVGVNTGGPVAAGVLGMAKPTFEILGPAINRAQQMQQNGIPMMVHISLPVYELIRGLNFKFGERRTIKCKNETLDTYLVEP